MLALAVHANRGRAATPVPGPALPWTAEDVSPVPDSPLDFAAPSGAMAYGYSNRVGEDGAPQDFSGSVGDDPSLPPAWRRTITSGQQVNGVGINLNDQDPTNVVNGWGQMRPPSEMMQWDDEPYITLFPDARYEGEVVPAGPANYQWQIWPTPVTPTNAPEPPLEAIFPYVGAL